ncbi:M15 family metallopeptidase [Persicitalea sp.]|uniref:M15 family metallopeptidase n=1 Tax=Persicitalea sp. TaxID=3100273 RepID=UPI00359387B8
MKKNGLILFLALLSNFACQSSSKDSQSPGTLTQTVVSVADTVPELRPIPALERQMIKQGLVNVQTIDSTISVELKYSTTDNFVKKDVYGDLENAYLQLEVAKKLARASTLLRKTNPGYRLLIYDAARPNSVQQILWDEIKVPERQKPQYVANPKIGSIHNFGCAIDLTVANEKGVPLDMGTPYDFFGPLAYPRMESQMVAQGKLTKAQLANRQILRRAMTQAGFRQNTTEWWHYDGLSRANAKAKYGMIK